MRRYLPLPLFVLVPAMALGQQSSSLQGKWTGTMAGKGAGELGVELVIGEATGTWRFTARGGRAKDNPCIGKEFPVEVTSQSDAEVRFKVDGASVIQGCVDQSAVLRSTGPNSLDGTLADGRALKLTRR